MSTGAHPSWTRSSLSTFSEAEDDGLPNKAVERTARWSGQLARMRSPRPLSAPFDVILASWGSESMNIDGQWQLTGNAAELYESASCSLKSSTS